jgi:hypothetical protein
MTVINAGIGTPEFAPPKGSARRGATNRETTMRHLTSTIQRLDLPHDEFPTRDRAATEGRAWLLRRLRWEHRLAELRTEHEHASRT